MKVFSRTFFSVDFLVLNKELLLVFVMTNNWIHHSASLIADRQKNKNVATRTACVNPSTRGA